MTYSLHLLNLKLLRENILKVPGGAITLYSSSRPNHSLPFLLRLQPRPLPPCPATAFSLSAPAQGEFKQLNQKNKHFFLFRLASWVSLAMTSSHVWVGDEITAGSALHSDLLQHVTSPRSTEIKLSFSEITLGTKYRFYFIFYQAFHSLKLRWFWEWDSMSLRMNLFFIGHLAVALQVLRHLPTTSTALSSSPSRSPHQVSNC